jgi:hypothetical protein
VPPGAGGALPGDLTATPTTYGLPDYPGYLPPIHRTARYPVVLGAVAAIMVIGLVLNVLFTEGFPSQAPVEQAFSGLLTFDLSIGALALAIIAIIFAVRRSPRPSKIGGMDGFSLAGLSCGILAVIGWLLLCAPHLVGNAITGERGKYNGNVGGVVLAGIPWILSFVFGAIAVRRGATRLSNGLALASIACGLAILVPVLIASFIYGLGLSD